MVLPFLPEPTHGPDHLVVDSATPLEEEDLNNGAEVHDPSDNEDGSVIEEEVVEPPPHSRENRSFPAVDPTPEALEDAPKQSYASIVSLRYSFFFSLFQSTLNFLFPSISDYHLLFS